MKLSDHVLQAHISLLGRTVYDAVTGFAGVITDVSFNIDGGIDAFVKPKVDASGKMQEGYWFDVQRLVTDK